MITLELKNRAAFERSFDALQKRILKSVLKALAEGGEALAENARGRVAVKSGSLRDSISVKTSEDGLSLEVSAKSPYAGFVEFGTRRSPAQPFLVPAAEEEFPRIRSALVETLNRAIKN